MNTNTYKDAIRATSNKQQATSNKQVYQKTKLKSILFSGLLTLGFLNIAAASERHIEGANYYYFYELCGDIRNKNLTKIKKKLFPSSDNKIQISETVSGFEVLKAFLEDNKNNKLFADYKDYIWKALELATKTYSTNECNMPSTMPDNIDDTYSIMLDVIDKKIKKLEEEEKQLSNLTKDEYEERQEDLRERKESFLALKQSNKNKTADSVTEKARNNLIAQIRELEGRYRPDNRHDSNYIEEWDNILWGVPFNGVTESKFQIKYNSYIRSLTKFYTPKLATLIDFATPKWNNDVHPLYIRHINFKDMFSYIIEEEEVKYISKENISEAFANRLSFEEGINNYDKGILSINPVNGPIFYISLDDFTKIWNDLLYKFKNLYDSVIITYDKDNILDAKRGIVVTLFHSEAKFIPINEYDNTDKSLYPHNTKSSPSLTRDEILKNMLWDSKGNDQKNVIYKYSLNPDVFKKSTYGLQ